MSNQQLNKQYSFETLSDLSHTKKLLDPSSYKNYLNQQSSLHKLQKTQSTFTKSGVSSGFENINFNVSPLDMPRCTYEFIITETELFFFQINWQTQNESQSIKIQTTYQEILVIYVIGKQNQNNFYNEFHRYFQIQYATTVQKRVFRDQTKSSQKQKFGVRDKEQALKNLSIQQENLRKLKQAKTSNDDSSQQRPIKDAGLNDQRGFLKKVFEFNDMKMVVMFKSIEVEAIQKGSNESQKGKKRISQLIFFEDLKYLVENFSLDEISDLFKKCIYVQNNKIQIDYKKFTSLPSKKPTGSLLEKNQSFPQQQDYTQEESSMNKDNNNGYRGKYIIKVQFPLIEMYISEFAHKQTYYTKKKDILDLFKSKFESLKDYLRHFDSSKFNISKAEIKSQTVQIQKIKDQSPLNGDLTIHKGAQAYPKEDLLTQQNAQQSQFQEDYTVQKGRLQKQDSNKSEKNKKNEQEEQQQQTQPLNLKIDKKESEEDQKLKYFQESLNERLKTISEQQQTQQDDEEEQEQLINAIKEKKSTSSQNSSKNYDEKFEKQSDKESDVKYSQQNEYNQKFESKESEQIFRQKSESQQQQNTNEQNYESQDFEEVNINQRQEHEEREKIAPQGIVEDQFQQDADRNETYKEEQSNEYESQFEQDQQFQGQENEQIEGQEEQQFEQYEEEQFEGQDGQEFQGQDGEQYQQEGEEYQEQEQFGQDSQQQEGSEQYGQDSQQYEGAEQFEGEEGEGQYEGGEGEEQYQGEESNQEGEQEMDIPQFSIEETDREFDPSILQENIVAQGVVWNDANYIIGFKSLDIIIESNSFEGKILRSLNFLELYTLIQETRESVVEEYLMQKLAINENMEVAIDLPQMDFDLQECFTLEEGHFYKFLDELNDFEINMEEQAFLIQFILYTIIQLIEQQNRKPSIEISDEQGMNQKQMEVDGSTLQSIVQRGFHFDFIVAQ